MALPRYLPIHIHIAAREAFRSIIELLILNHLLVRAVFGRIRVILSQPPSTPKLLPEDRFDDHDNDGEDRSDLLQDFSLDG
ncbi:hypothetical protein SISNIDRAFT_491878 [Sistotremastrum niveocremeum HHB9708]|uniref:Uncharacterized protein n=1 Tax=Sistotremastrum niveocremeum HHB9708 TaxID=1314777 RepID=A0A164MAG5_9AGAM|nr:hypothetical protein SISNIDRAFT_491878 [Sistotremastrum niveocremeum HHB9708]